MSLLVRYLKFRAKAYLADFVGPEKVRIDASSICQLKCPICPTASGENRKAVVGSGFLSPEDFGSFLSNNPRVKSVELSNWGEIFLNPQISEILRIGAEHGVSLMCRNGSNLNTLDEEKAEAIVRHRLQKLSVSIDGATQETYGKYRVGGDLQRVLSNVRLINKYKEQYRSGLPRIRWQFVVFGHNAHELEAARAMATELGMEFYAKLNHAPSYSPVVETASLGKGAGQKYIARYNYQRESGLMSARPCLQLWFAPQINWDGKLLGCCENIYSDFGNVFSEGLSACLRSKKYRYAKAMVLGKARPDPGVACSRCKVYLASKGPFSRLINP